MDSSFSGYHGVTYVAWEFILHDRAQEKLKKEAVLQLMLSGQNESISKSAHEIQKVFSELRKNDEASIEDWVKLQTIYFPIQAHLSAWGFVRRLLQKNKAQKV